MIVRSISYCGRLASNLQACCALKQLLRQRGRGVAACFVEKRANPSGIKKLRVQPPDGSLLSQAASAPADRPIAYRPAVKGDAQVHFGFCPGEFVLLASPISISVSALSAIGSISVAHCAGQVSGSPVVSHPDRWPD